MSHLPTWAQSPQALSLLAEIRRDPPAYIVNERASSCGVETRRYQGDAANALRRLCDEAAGRLFNEAERSFASGMPWQIASADANACFAMNADKLIASVIEGLTEVHGDPMRANRRAA